MVVSVLSYGRELWSRCSKLYHIKIRPLEKNYCYKFLELKGHKQWCKEMSTQTECEIQEWPNKKI